MLIARQLASPVAHEVDAIDFSPFNAPPHRARTITINVGFSLHVFTYALSDAEPRPEEYRDHRECRAFDYERYRASLHLEALVRGLETRKCYFARNKNFFTAEIAYAPEGHEHQVFFAVRPDRTNADTVALIVQSAYFGPIKQAPRDVARRKPVGFRAILLNTLLRKPLREPP